MENTKTLVSSLNEALKTIRDIVDALNVRADEIEQEVNEHVTTIQETYNALKSNYNELEEITVALNSYDVDITNDISNSVENMEDTQAFAEDVLSDLDALIRHDIIVDSEDEAEDEADVDYSPEDEEEDTPDLTPTACEES